VKIIKKVGITPEEAGEEDDDEEKEQYK